ncbi:MAG: hypothetical protein V1740_06805 [Candidatus Woesearchaeota archaeon]
MGTKFPLPIARIKYRGLFDYKELTNNMRRWFIDSNYEFNEGTYKHKVPSPAGYEQELKWKAERKVTGYVLYRIKVYFHIWDIKEVDVVKDSKKKKMWDARVLIEMDGEVELDWNNYFEKGKFLEGIREWINKYLLFTKIQGGWTDELYYHIYKLHLVTKQSLGMSTPTDSSRYRY